MKLIVIVNMLIASAQNTVHSSDCHGAADGIDFLWVSVLSFSHEAVKSMFHTQMRWVSLLHPCFSDPSPSLAWLPGTSPSRLLGCCHDVSRPTLQCLGFTEWQFSMHLNSLCPPHPPTTGLAFVLFCLLSPPLPAFHS